MQLRHVDPPGEVGRAGGHPPPEPECVRADGSQRGPRNTALQGGQPPPPPPFPPSTSPSLGRDTSLEQVFASLNDHEQVYKQATSIRH